MKTPVWHVSSPTRAVISITVLCLNLVGLAHIAEEAPSQNPQVDQPVLDTNGDGVIDNLDSVVRGFKSNADSGDTVLTKAKGGSSRKKFRGSAQNTVGSQLFETYYRGVCGKKIADRVWRQIINAPHAK